EALAKLWGKSNDEINEYLARENELIDVDDTVREFLNDEAFAGTYLNVINKTINVYTIDFSQTRNITDQPK
ncbi:1786_t:CDS:1, partial [Cetraspora pellucida]